FDSVATNVEIYEWVRVAACRAYLYLVCDDRVSRKFAVERLQRQLIGAMEANDEFMTTSLVMVLSELGPREALSDITRAYELNLAEEFSESLDYIRETCTWDEAKVREELKKLPKVSDAIQSL